MIREVNTAACKQVLPSISGLGVSHPVLVWIVRDAFREM